MSFFENTRKPVGFGGRVMVSIMNLGHRALADWGFRFLRAAENAIVLDCGCGGGANIKRLLKTCTRGHVYGIDYSEVSVAASQKNNRAVIKAGRCTISQAGVTDLPFESAMFDLVTAFETVYFWPDLPQCFLEIHRVLKHGGTFLICNECGGDNADDEKWTKKIAGMTIYKDTDLKIYLEQAKFCDIQVHKNKQGWMCITAQK